MKVYALFLLASILIGLKVDAQSKDSIIQYPLIVKFASICCGVPSDKLLRKEIKTFKTRYKIKKISADKISPMGREGEYWLGFSLKDIPSKRRNIFIERICNVTKKMIDKGNAYCEKEISVTKSSMPDNINFEKIKF